MKRLLLALLVAGHPAAAAVIVVGPETPPGVSAAAGDTIRLLGGHYRASVILRLTGTARAPVTVLGDGPIEIDGALVLDHAAFVTLRDVRIVRAADAGVILRRGSHDILVSAVEISAATVGAWIGDGAGDGNRIEDSSIGSSRIHGIAVDGVVAAAGRETVIARNRIVGSGAHGIEVSGNHAIVADNLVTGSGWRVAGASGIHVYAHDAARGVGRDNLIRGNVVVGTHDATGQDGNGIQIDQWCDDNAVVGNLVTGNDGAGISVFDAARALLAGNIVIGNMRDPGRSHRHRGELVFASDDTRAIDGTRGAVARDNIVVPTKPGAAAIVVDRPTARHPPLLSGNLIRQAAGGAPP